MALLGLTALASGCASSNASTATPPPITVTTTVVAPQTPSSTPSPPTQPTTTTPTTSPAPPPTQAPPTPATVLAEYYAAVNAFDYRRAWALGGDHLVPDYGTFVADYADTLHDDLSILSTNGDVVTMRLTATHVDGSKTFYQGTYTIHDGVIVAANVQQTGAAPALPSGMVTAPNGSHYHRGEICSDDYAELTTVDADGNVLICTHQTGVWRWS